MTEAETLLKELAEALDSAYISSWQGTHHWDKELQNALKYLEKFKDPIDNESI